MKKITYIAACIASLVIISCGQKTSSETIDQAADTTAKVCNAPDERNPNGVSELAAVMRVMESQTELWKTEIAEDKETLSAMPDAYNTLKTAKVTEPEMKNDNFNGFADNFLSFTNAFVKSPKEDRKTAFNAMVSACLTCHNQMCPGPVKRINKFMLQ